MQLLITGIAILVIAIIIVFKWRYKIAKSNQALVISGGKKGKKGEAPGPVVLVSGGAFISPVKRHEFFSLAVITVVSDDRETQTKTVVPVVVKWTAQLKPDTETEGSLAKAVMGFIGKSESDIERSLQQTLEGEVRAVVATLTPEEVIEGREKFKKDIEDNVKERMAELGFKLISLNITEVKDNNNHYNNLAARDREEKRRVAENLTAEAQKSIDVIAAETSQASESARIAANMTVAEKNRDLQLKQAGFREETDKANKTADFAGRLEEQDRLKELAAKEGNVAVERQIQSKRASEAHREVETTIAETERQKTIINAEAEKAKREIGAEAEAETARRKARGDAQAAIEKARGEADAKKAAADAEAERIRKTRTANAQGIEAEGRAEAEAIRQKGLAEAEAERAKAAALAAHEGVNFRVALAEIESRTRVEVSTAIADAVAEVGTNTTIIDMGGGSGGSGGEGDLLSKFLGGLPETLAKLDIKNGALNGKAITESLNDIVNAIFNRPSEFVESEGSGAPAYNRMVADKEESADADADDGAVYEANEDVVDDVSGESVVDGMDEEAHAENADDPSGAAADDITVAGVEEPFVAPQEAGAGESRPDTVVDGTDKTRWLPEETGAAESRPGITAVAYGEYHEEPNETYDASVAVSKEIEAVITDIAEEYNLNKADTDTITQVCAAAENSGGYGADEVLDLAAKTVDVIKGLHTAGEDINVKSIVKGMLKDSNVGADEIVKKIIKGIRTQRKGRMMKGMH